MGCRRLAGHGKSAATTARSAFGPFARGICCRISIGGRLLLLRLSSLGMATNVLHWRTPGVACDFRSSQGEGVGSLGENTPRKLGQAWPFHRIALETLYLSNASDDDDELRFPRHSRYVSHAP